MPPARPAGHRQLDRVAAVVDDHLGRVADDERARPERIGRLAAVERVHQGDDAGTVAQQDLEAHLVEQLADAVEHLVRLHGGTACSLDLRVRHAGPRRLEHRVADDRHGLGVVEEEPGGAPAARQLGGGEQLEAFLLPGDQAHRAMVAARSARRGAVHVIEGRCARAHRRRTNVATMAANPPARSRRDSTNAVETIAGWSIDPESTTCREVRQRRAARHPRPVRGWPRPGAGCTIRDPNGGSDPWGCVVSTGSGCLETRAEVPSGLVKQAANEVTANKQPALALAA